jgi:hypothetical protein
MPTIWQRFREFWSRQGDELDAARIENEQVEHEQAEREKKEPTSDLPPHRGPTEGFIPPP